MELQKRIVSVASSRVTRLVCFVSSMSSNNILDSSVGLERKFEYEMRNRMSIKRSKTEDSLVKFSLSSGTTSRYYQRVYFLFLVPEQMNMFFPRIPQNRLHSGNESACGPKHQTRTSLCISCHSTADNAGPQFAWKTRQDQKKTIRMH
ncbi:beta-lactamase [Striga asiatica]|uniref:Beta-lactamase n=1 Tax=Striga asiatica TaxID=4170 RepID=A0A5A7QI68_STRAF|nr:beta-lactamase [Striga asiatica]